MVRKRGTRVLVTSTARDVYASCRGCGWNFRLKTGPRSVASTVRRMADQHVTKTGHVVEVQVMTFEVRELVSSGL